MTDPTLRPRLHTCQNLLQTAARTLGNIVTDAKATGMGAQWIDALETPLAKIKDANRQIRTLHRMLSPKKDPFHAPGHGPTS